MRGRRLTIAFAVAGLAALAAPGDALACSCANRTAAEALRQADAALVGRLIAVVPRDGYRADFRYRVRRVFKSGRGLARGGTVTVRASSSGAACGLPTAVGRRYGLLLFRSEGRWTGNSCNLAEPRELATAAAGPHRNRDLEAAGLSCNS